MNTPDEQSPAPLSKEQMVNPYSNEYIYNRNNSQRNDKNLYFNDPNIQTQAHNNNPYNAQQQPQVQNQYEKENPYNKEDIQQNNVIISSELKNKEEDDEIKKNIHNGFIKKVYGILLFQFTFTFGIVLICQIKKIKNYLYNHSLLEAILIIISAVVLFVIFIIIICKPKLLKKTPQNYIVLFITTIAETIILSYVAILYKFVYVLIALVMVIVICIAVFLFCCFKKIDTKYLIMVILILVLLAFVYGIFILSYRDYYLELFYCLLGAIFFLLFLIYDTQNLIHSDEDGNYQYDTDEYIMAALTLYFDIIRMFIELLKLIGRFSGGSS